MFDLPLEYALIEFEGGKFSGKIVPELLDLARRGIVRFVDIVFIQKDEDGSTRTVELNDLDPETYEMFVPIGEHVSSLFTNDDLEIAASKLPNNSAAMLILVGEPVGRRSPQGHRWMPAASWWSATRSLPKWSRSSSRDWPRRIAPRGSRPRSSERSRHLEEVASWYRRGPNPPGPIGGVGRGPNPPGPVGGVGRGPNPPGPVGGVGRDQIPRAPSAEWAVDRIPRAQSAASEWDVATASG